MIKITRDGVTGITDTLLEELKNEFAEKQCIVLPRLIDEDILANIVAQIDNAAFVEKKHSTPDNRVFASGLSIDNQNIALQQITFLLNNASLFKAVQYITNCPVIRGFSGRIYRNMPDSEHHLDWHDDMSDQPRLVALSMNLSTNHFENGRFQIREKGSAEILREVGSGNLGDTHIFAISQLLQHRVTKTTGLYPRTAAAGWFMATPSLLFAK